ncbi:MAG: hypothetical protein BMS9Abin17_0924 [Acidimicrobiia bacterium]|nr:MAG: hypothetical protein BMS9Abin17_0924 [Acidimicrobiia bacterium]
MSPRAACRLEALGFENVYDYTLGIADWKAANLPIEGEPPEVQLVGDATRPDVPTATPGELLGEVLDRTTEAGWDEAFVLDCDGIVAGRLRGKTWQKDRSLRVDEVMEIGPTTVRPGTVLEPLVKRMEERGTKLVAVSTAQGALLGVLLLADALSFLSGESPKQIWVECDGCPGGWKTV